MAADRKLRLEHALDPLVWLWCAVAWALVMAIPITKRGDLLDRFKFWLLPFAGFYAYHEPGVGATWRWSERVRERPTCGRAI